MTAVNELIALELIKRLKRIRRHFGYSFNVGKVERADRDLDAFQPDALDIYIEQQPDELNEELSCPGNPPESAYDQVFFINGYSRRLDVQDTAPGVVEKRTTENDMRSAILQAIGNDDPSGWHTFGGHAFNASFPASEQFNEPGFDGVTVTLLVQYRTVETNPSLARGA